tara:strand:- start:719 stop:1267 length:549 start_codon:yes stop_codon:yes gene_type:complete
MNCNNLSQKQALELFNEFSDKYGVIKGVASTYSGVFGKNPFRQDYFKNFSPINSEMKEELRIKYGQHLREMYYNPKNPFLIYGGLIRDKEEWGGTPSMVEINEKFRGFLMNRQWVIYYGEQTKIYWMPKSGLRVYVFNQGVTDEVPRWQHFSTPWMVDVTKYVCNSDFEFFNWKENPFDSIK